MKETPKQTIDLTDLIKELAKLALLHDDKAKAAKRLANSEGAVLSETIKQQFEELYHTGFAHGIIEALMHLQRRKNECKHNTLR